MTAKLGVPSKLAFLAAMAIVPPIHADLIAPYILADAYADATYPGFFDSNFHGDQAFDQYPASASILAQGVGNVSQSAMVEVDQGYFRSLVNVQGEGTTALPGQGHSWAETQLLDTLTVNGYTLILPLHIDGSIGITYALANPSKGIPGFVTFDMGCDASTDTSTDMDTCRIGGSPSTAFSPSLSYFWNSSTNVNLNLEFVMSTTPGVPFDFYWDTTLQAVLGLPPGNANISGDFSHTGLFGPAEVLDQFGNVISDPQITSANGYNYLDPTGPGSISTPEPRMTAMFVSGLLGVILAIRRRAFEPMFRS